MDIESHHMRLETGQHHMRVVDPLYHFDTHFPERFSRLHLHEPRQGSVKKGRRIRRDRNSSRYKTQPITFDEIKEVDEESTQDDSKQGLMNQFAAFSRSMDGLLPKGGAKGAEGGAPATGAPTSPTATTSTSPAATSPTSPGGEGEGKKRFHRPIKSYFTQKANTDQPSVPTDLDTKDTKG